MTLLPVWEQSLEQEPCQTKPWTEDELSPRRIAIAAIEDELSHERIAITARPALIQASSAPRRIAITVRPISLHQIYRPREITISCNSPTL
jgi:hypothetical protein